jgi:hypothetical protein
MTLLPLALAGCGGAIECPTPDTVVVAGGDPLRCADLDQAVGWVRAEAGRPLARGDDARIRASLVASFREDPERTKERLRDAAASAARLDPPGPETAVARSRALWESANGEGPFRGADGDVPHVWRTAVHVWAEHDGDRLAIGEADVEGWIHLASLCREIQGGGPLRLSVADRVVAYRLVTDRFVHGTERDRVGLASVGGGWERIAAAWEAAPYDAQQAFARAAPLPPPMTASSLGYAEAIFTGDVAGIADALRAFLAGADAP